MKTKTKGDIRKLSLGFFGCKKAFENNVSNVPWDMQQINDVLVKKGSAHFTLNITKSGSNTFDQNNYSVSTSGR